MKNEFYCFIAGMALMSCIYQGILSYKEESMRITPDEIRAAFKTCTELAWIEPPGKAVCKQLEGETEKGTE